MGDSRRVHLRRLRVARRGPGPDHEALAAPPRGVPRHRAGGRHARDPSVLTWVIRADPPKANGITDRVYKGLDLTRARSR